MSPIRTSETKGYKTLRAKFNGTGRGALMCWDSNKESCTIPEIWENTDVQPRFLIRGIWVTAKQFGLVLDMVDVMFGENFKKCPF